MKQEILTKRASGTSEFRLDSPLPQRFLTDSPGIGGRIKVQPDDFLVDEIPLYEPSGDGEHLYLHVQKTNVSHGELISVIRRHFRVKEWAIGYAGMKDKRAVTRQMISIATREQPETVDLDHERIKVLSVSRHRNKIKRGHLSGNRFAIRIREVDPLQTPQAMRVLRRIEQIGTPCHFGPQRFGYRANNHLLGAMLLNERWDDVLAELLGSRGTPFSEHQRERRELFDHGRYQEARALWGPADRAELIAIKALAGGSKPREAVIGIGKTTLNFWTSSLMSAAFNRVLDHRLEMGSFDQLVEGDLAWKHDTRNVFPVTAEELATDDLPGRLARFEISPSGPLFGEGYREAAGDIALIEREALEATGVPEDRMLNGRFAPQGGRRPLREPITNASLEGGVDDQGPFIRVAFDLPRGMYATVVLREIMKTELSEE